MPVHLHSQHDEQQAVQPRFRCTPHLSLIGASGALYASTASAMSTGKASVRSSGCQLNSCEVSFAEPSGAVDLGLRLRPPRWPRTQTSIVVRAPSCRRRASRVMASGGGGPIHQTTGGSVMLHRSRGEAGAVARWGDSKGGASKRLAGRSRRRRQKHWALCQDLHGPTA